ncbi:acyltransferase family protein [Parablastomonas sp. CN1-191]|uniref:acyltransferase family protein n=1 Tax=Parablastomonas sp. CN1-191 TaxID=3400908 RepID=UPI003BF77FEF
MSAMKYRADIDGLRALAVLPVVAHHMLLLPGGFIGVDIFFVISGYLISQIVFRETDQGSFSLGRFYERRVRRILPALLAMVLGVLLVSCLVFSPADTRSVAQSAIAAILSYANVHFWLHTGYFETGTVAMPLLHTWSLGVEEQFYLFFPPLAMLLARRGPAARIRVLVAIFAVSFALSAWGAYHDSGSAFYLLHSRAWELALGSILAATSLEPPANRAARDLIAAIGLAAIFAALWFYTPATPFPGFAALVPCLGAAAILWTGRQATFVSRLLSFGPVRFVGLISYSLYLVHWPVIVFQRTSWVLYAGPSRVIEKGLTLAVCLVLAVLSWRFVERPFRSRRASEDHPARVFAFGGGAAAALIAFAAVIVATGGLRGFRPARDDAFSRYLQYDVKTALRMGTCMVDENAANGLQRAPCLTLDPARPNVLLLGDSHAADLRSGMVNAFPGVNFLQATGSSCPPSVDSLASGYANCRAAIAEGVRLARSGAIDTVILSGNWLRFDYQSSLDVARQLRDAGVRVIIVGPSPEYDRPLPRLLELGRKTGNPDAPAAFRVRGLFELDRRMADDARGSGIGFLSRAAVVCPAGKCRTVIGHVPMLFDADHFTATGSTYVALIWREHGLDLSTRRRPDTNAL